MNLLSKKLRRNTKNRAKDYYENNKERLRVQARGKYRNLSEDEKKKKKKNIKKIIMKQKNLNIIINKIIF